MLELKDRLFLDRQTGKPFDYARWNDEYSINGFFGISESALNLEKLNTKTDKEKNASVDPKKHVPFAAELDDLIRLHFFARNRRATTILEFGVGKSTRIFAEALQRNKLEYGEHIGRELRRANPFALFSVDNSQKWIDHCKEELSEKSAGLVNFHFSEVKMSTFNDRICTLYDDLPNICPDLIYLDAPAQFGVRGNVRGISTESPDRLPMAADLLTLEHFLLPGTLIITDGRTANARFLKTNFQLKWDYHHFVEEDFHAFELVEAPLGKINEKQVDFCLGYSFN